MKNKHFLDCALLEVKTSDFSEKYFMFEGYASTFGNEDRGGDIVVRGAFEDTIKKMYSKAVPIKGTEFSKLMPVLWQHNWNEPIGSFVEMREDAKGLYVKGILPKSDDFVRGRVMPQMDAGSISDMSIGYIIEKESFTGKVRNIERAQLFETSLVTIPMNEEAVVTGFKSHEIKGLPVADASQVFDAKNMTYDGNDAFLIVREDVKLLPIADMVGDELSIIPKAVFDAALQVHKGDVTDGMTIHDITDVKDALGACYKQMGLESPFTDKGAFYVNDIKSLSERELETLLKGGVCFSQKTAKSIVSLLNDDAQRDVDAKSQRDAELKAEINKLIKTFTQKGHKYV